MAGGKRIIHRKMSLGDVFASPFVLLPRNPAFLLPPLVDVWLKIVVLGASVVAFSLPLLPFLQDVYTPTESGTHLSPWDGNDVLIHWAVTFCVALILLLLITIFTSGWVCAMFVDIDEKGKIGLRSSLKTVRRSFWALVRAMILEAVLALILGVLGTACSLASWESTKSDGQLILTAGIAVLALLVMAISLLYTGPAIVKHRSGAVTGMVRSWNFTWHRNFLRTLCVILVPPLLAAGVSFLVPLGPKITSLLSTFFFPLLLPYAYVKYGGLISQTCQTGIPSWTEENDKFIGKGTGRKADEKHLSGSQAVRRPSSFSNPG